MDWLISGSQPGDKVLFYYSGHGAQVADTHGDEEDGLEETLCPVDTNPTRGNMITDDEINERLKRLNGRRVLVVIDSCHSGTISKGNLPKGIRLKTPLFTKPLPETKGINKGIISESLISSSKQGETVVYSAVAANQLAIDTPEGGEFSPPILSKRLRIEKAKSLIRNY